MSKEKSCPSEYRFFLSSLGLIDYNSGTTYKNNYTVLLDGSHNGNIDWRAMANLFSETSNKSESSQEVRKRSKAKYQYTVNDAIYRIYDVIEELAMNTEDVIVSPSAINAVSRDAEETGKFRLKRQLSTDDNSHEIWIEMTKKFKDLAARCLTQHKRKFLRDKAQKEKMNTPPPDWLIKILFALVIIIPILIVFSPRNWYK